MLSAPTSDEIQEWVMALMALKSDSEQRKKRTAKDVPRQTVVDIGTLGTDTPVPLLVRTCKCI